MELGEACECRVLSRAGESHDMCFRKKGLVTDSKWQELELGEARQRQISWGAQQSSNCLKRNLTGIGH